MLISFNIRRRHIYAFLVLVALFAGITTIAAFADTSGVGHRLDQLGCGSSYATDCDSNSNGVIDNADKVGGIAFTSAAKWRNVKNDRLLGTVYTNTKAYPIYVSVTTANGGSNNNACDATLLIGEDNSNLVQVMANKDNWNNYFRNCPVFGIVPAGHKYKVMSDPYGGSPEVDVWAEMY